MQDFDYPSMTWELEEVSSLSANLFKRKSYIKTHSHRTKVKTKAKIVLVFVVFSLIFFAFASDFGECEWAFYAVTFQVFKCRRQNGYVIWDCIINYQKFCEI